MKLPRFHSFNELANQDVYKLDANALYILNSDVCVSFIFDGSEMYTLNVFNDKQTCELTNTNIETIRMSYDEVPTNKEKIISLEPTTENGELLYKWVARNLAVVEWSNSSIVSDWHTFESESYGEPLGTTDRQSASSRYYTFNTAEGIFGLEILRDSSTFKLLSPSWDGAIIGTRLDLFQNGDYYRMLAADGVIYNWIESCLNILSHP